MILKNRTIQLFFFGLIILFSFGLFILKKRKPNLTHILIKEKTINVGEVDSQRNIKVQFELINEGEESLIISNVEASCHCTLPSWSKSPIELNEKGIINVEYHGDRTGYFQEDVLVYCNVKYSPLLLTLEGEVINVDNQ